MKQPAPTNKEADGNIIHTFTLNNKLYAMTATSTYRVRIRKRRRDSKKTDGLDCAILKYVTSAIKKT